MLSQTPSNTVASATQETEISIKKQSNLTAKDYYFDSYSHFGIHEEMLKDTSRTLAYRNSIVQNKHLFKDKVVLDVGCGTGILSMFAAQAGAKLVIGVDMSGIIEKARLIVEENGFSEKIILIQGKMEEIQLPVEKVDIIISEWMGYFLLYESMLNTVLYARDKYLTEEGLIFPDKATMYIAGIEDAEYKEEKLGFWDDVYGFKMTAIKELAFQEPLVDTVDGKAIITNSVKIKEIDIKTVTVEELSFESEFSLTFLKDDFMHAFISYFDVTFSACHKPIVLSTSPYAKYTHWKQSVFYTKEVLMGKRGETFTGRITCKPNERNHRDMDITLSYEHGGIKEDLEFQMS